MKKFCRGDEKNYLCRKPTDMDNLLYRIFQVLLWIVGIAIVAAVAVVSFRLGQMLK